MPTITIGFVPRERFSLAAESLQRLFDYTPIPFDLVVVDCNIPAPYRRQMDDVLRGRPNVTIIQRDHYMLPNQSKNLVIGAATGEFLCIVENDVLVLEGWLARLLAAAEEHPADVAVPLIIEGPVGHGKVHFDDLLGEVEAVAGPTGTKLRIVRRQGKREEDRRSTRRTVHCMEQHCLLFRRSVFDRIGLYDEELNTRDEVDLSLALHQGGARVVFEPQAVVHYIPPYPPREDELPYFYLKWDLDRAARSRVRIQEKWNLVEVPGDLAFVRDRNLIGQLHRVKEELRSLAVPGQPMILVDGDEWRGTDMTAGLDVLPFLEKDGQSWGAPDDDATAIRELERMRSSGASHIIFAWQAFWWFDHYAGFRDHLRAKYRPTVENDRLVAFDLHSGCGNGPGGAKQSA
jgi:GT2 family glycosyltransferase